MGCWNGTCGISNLPIREGDSVVCLVVSISNQHHLRGDYCSITDVVDVVSLPMRAVYSGYGGVTNIEQSYIRDKMKDMFGLEDPEHGVGGETFLSSMGGEEVTYMWMIHASIYDSFKDSVKLSSWEPGENEGGSATWVRKDFNYHKSILDDSKEISGLFWDVSKPTIRRGRNHFTDLIISSITVLPGDLSRLSLNCTAFDGAYSEIINKALSDSDVDLWNRIVDDFAGYGCLIKAMEDLRIGFNVQLGSGSQSEKYDSYKALICEMNKIIASAEVET